MLADGEDRALKLVVDMAGLVVTLTSRVKRMVTTRCIVLVLLGGLLLLAVGGGCSSSESPTPVSNDVGEHDIDDSKEGGNAVEVSDDDDSIATGEAPTETCQASPTAPSCCERVAP